MSLATPLSQALTMNPPHHMGWGQSTLVWTAACLIVFAASHLGFPWPQSPAHVSQLSLCDDNNNRNKDGQQEQRWATELDSWGWNTFSALSVAPKNFFVPQSSQQ